MQSATSSSGRQPSRRDFLKTSASGAALGALAMNVGVHAAGSDVIKVGLIGCGSRGPGAAQNALNVDSGAKLVAMCDILLERIHGARKSLKDRKPDQVDVTDDRCFAGLDGYKKVIECSDVVLIACAAKFHPLYAKAALEAGKHVFFEKPHAIDPLGVKMVIAACELAKQKKLSIVSGLQSRFHPGIQETVKRIHDGAIGDVVAMEEKFLRPPYRLVPRAKGLTELQFQFSNQYHFTWLSGDDVPQSLIHNLDRSLWVMHDQVPVKCHGLAGRSAMFDEVYGNVFDHHSVIYEFANGVKVYAFCRTTTGCYDEVASYVFGTKGRANMLGCWIEGETKWKYEGNPDPYDLEIKALLDAVRSGKPINSGYHCANSTLTTVMGQISCYTGKQVTWEQASKSDFCFEPKPEDCRDNMEAPVKPGPNGQYAVYVPGQTKLL